MGQYDKLGNLLKDAIDSGDLDNERKIRQNSKAVYPSEENPETVPEEQQNNTENTQQEQSPAENTNLSFTPP